MSKRREIQTAETTSHKASRLPSLDAMRGLVIVLMALDHANYFVAQQHPPGEYWGGVFPAYDSALAFLTRLVTHLAPSGFFFLMGVGMLLFANSRQKRGWSRWAIIRHFLIRGGLLIALQLLIVNRAWELSPGGWGLRIYIGVLFALGGTMILGSLLVGLKPTVLLGVTVVLFLGTELLHPNPSLWGVITADPANLLLLRPGGDTGLWANYPVLPWLELVTFGMLFGHWLVKDSHRAFRRALGLGGAFLGVFVVIRTLDGFGNIRPRVGNGWIDLLNVVKYPPSMTYTMLTMGVNLTVLGLLGRASERSQRFLQPLVVFGRTPLFFYVLHLFLYAGLGYLLAPNGTSILVMVPFWLLGLLILYPLCLWYGRLKQRQPANSILRYF